MALIERTAYPRFGRNPSAQELARFYTPTLREIDLARRITRGGESQQLAFLVMLKSFQCLGYFPDPEEVPEALVSHVRSRLGLGPDTLAVPPPRSRQRYRDAIREHLGVKTFGGEARRLAMEMVSDAALSMDDPADLVNVAIEELVKERFELPAFSTLDRLTRHTRYRVNSRLFSRVDERMTNAMKSSLDALLESGPRGRSELNLLKEVPKSATKKNLSEMQERLLWLQSLGDTDTLLEGIPNQKVEHLSAQGLQQYIAAVEDALAQDDGDPWSAFSEFMRRIVDADTHSLTLRLAGTFSPIEDLNRQAAKAQELNVRLFERTKAAGAIRSDFEVGDITLLLEQLAAVGVADEERTRQLRHRYLALILDALHTTSGTQLPGPPPSWQEIAQRWET